MLFVFIQQIGILLISIWPLLLLGLVIYIAVRLANKHKRKDKE